MLYLYIRLEKMPYIWIAKIRKICQTEKFIFRLSFLAAMPWDCSIFIFSYISDFSLF